jgi:hypothetical protein
MRVSSAGCAALVIWLVAVTVTTVLYSTLRNTETKLPPCAHSQPGHRHTKDSRFQPSALSSLSPDTFSEHATVRPDGPHPQLNGFTRPLTPTTLKSLLENVQWSEAYRYGMKDSRGNGMDCMRVIAVPLGKTVRYLSVYHARSRVTKQFEIHLAQSLDLVEWEHLRRVVVNADMPVIHHDSGSGSVLLVFEQFLSSTQQSPCMIGVRHFTTIQHLISGGAAAMGTSLFRVPNTLSKIEGTPSIDWWDPERRVIRLWFHWMNEKTTRDEVAIGTLSDFPGTSPRWSARKHTSYVRNITHHGVTGNVGGRHHLHLDNQHHLNHGWILQEGNTQSLPVWPTNWTAWRVWLYSEASQSFVQLKVNTHGHSTALANPAAAVLPCPTTVAARTTATQESCLVVTYFIFREGAAKRESGQLLFYTHVQK